MLRLSFVVFALYITTIAAGSVLANPSISQEIADCHKDTGNKRIGCLAYVAGRKDFLEGRYEKALKHFIRAAMFDPAPRLIYNQARCYEMMGQIPKAIEGFEAYLHRVPTDPDAATLRQKVEAMKKRLTTSRGYLASNGPVISTPLQEMLDQVGLYLKRGQTKAAKRYLEENKDMAGASQSGLFWLYSAQAFYQLQELENSLVCLGPATKIGVPERHRASLKELHAILAGQFTLVTININQGKLRPLSFTPITGMVSSMKKRQIAQIREALAAPHKQMRLAFPRGRYQIEGTTYQVTESPATWNISLTPAAVAAAKKPAVPAPSENSYILEWSLVGVGAVGLGVATYAFLDAKGNADSIPSRVMTLAEYRSREADYNRMNKIGIGGLILGGAALSTAAGLYFFGGDDTPQAPRSKGRVTQTQKTSIRWAPVVTPFTQGLSLGINF